MQAARYTGRFAPSPTGELHFGSLTAAVASYCDARANHGDWLLRIDDIDPPREVPGAAESIQQTLQSFGFEWDANTLFQSTHIDKYKTALDKLILTGLLYPCTCTRRELVGHRLYPGTCATIAAATAASRVNTIVHGESTVKSADASSVGTAVRMHMDGSVAFDDRIQGMQNINLIADVGDMVLWRKHGLVSYALACAVDDSSGITHVVRGADLLPTSAAQLAIMQALARAAPSYAHIPVVTNEHGQKLSKQTLAAPIANETPLSVLQHAWTFLGQQPQNTNSVKQFWHTAFQRWDISAVPCTANKRIGGICF